MEHVVNKIFKTHARAHTHTHTHTHIQILIAGWGKTKSLEPEIINGPNIFLPANK